ncbi:hypothetical protein CAC42_5026 [Sphaceloma murrayae]|uniref:tRNA (guanine(10)-N(2))-methyltransferase n=1 Tax=Sphaceloma murrayae TaxID=2082308 RepID=A0A2K1R144_9PEZI|nr:hypothetical protein CAC42_5026 [Sphaceloma murrayae]
MTVSMDLYLIRFVQIHERFRLSEIKALSEYHGIPLEVVDYRPESPFCIVRLPSDKSAALLISRSVLALSISHLWATAPDHPTLHSRLHATTSHMWPDYHQTPFRFHLDTFQAKRSQSAKTALIDSFSYLNLRGPIRPSDDSVCTFVISEEHRPLGHHAGHPSPTHRLPDRVFLSRHLAVSGRHLVTTYDLKRRNYISTTSMDAELALVTANMALCGTGRVVYDPFCGTGSFLVAAAEFGAMVVGSDLDGRVVRGRIKETRAVKGRKGMGRGGGAGGAEEMNGKSDGKSKLERSVRGNLMQYGLQDRWLDGFVSDLTNSPVRTEAFGPRKPGTARWLDAIICDPPYGVREGLKVLGSHKPELQSEVKMKDGQMAHLAPGYLPPKVPYSFDAMLADILAFAADSLVDDGRLCMWIPVEGVAEGGDGEGADQQQARDQAVPTHPALRIKSISTQDFARWSRRLVVYTRTPARDIDPSALEH